MPITESKWVWSGKLQTNPLHGEEKPQNNNSHKTVSKTIKVEQPALSSSQDDCKLETKLSNA